MRASFLIAAALLAAAAPGWAGTFEQLVAFPKVRDIAMSPDGRHVAIVAPFEDQQSLYLIAVDDKDQGRVLRFRPGHTVANVTWVDDERVVFQKALQTAALEMPLLSGEYYSASINSKRQRLVFGGRQAMLEHSGFGHAREIFVIDQVPGSFFAQFTRWRGGDDSGQELWRVNARTGRQQLIASRDANEGTMFVDNQLEPRIVHGYDVELEPIARFRSKSEEEWQTFPRELVGRSLQPQFFGPDQELYALISDQGEPESLYRVDLERGQRQRLAGRTDAAVLRSSVPVAMGRPPPSSTTPDRQGSIFFRAPIRTSRTCSRRCSPSSRGSWCGPCNSAATMGAYCCRSNPTASRPTGMCSTVIRSD